MHLFFFDKTTCVYFKCLVSEDLTSTVDLSEAYISEPVTVCYLLNYFHMHYLSDL